MTQQITIHQHPYFVALRRLELPVDDFIIAGSGPLLAHGIRTEVSDIDVVTRGPAWDIVRTMGEVQDAPWEDVQRVLLMGGRMEVLNGWFPSMWDVDEFISSREFYLGLPFAPLDRVLRWKRRLGRAKDLADIDATLHYLTRVPFAS
ncbi:hypothetical protein ACFOVU_26525 [Nocardiopsis sediminis]|uniref:Nucleotidyltransferase family protein n=1 Tax=Nocardiopsis sediminis TaxID=1778267 RepID=A0ABV8FXW1_9ACTN